MKSAQMTFLASGFLLLSGIFSEFALATVDQSYSRISDKMTGSLGVIQAFQAIRDKNAVGLTHALSATPSPVDETITIAVDSAKVQLRLIHIAVLMKEPHVISLLRQAGANFAAKDSLGRTAAHYASFGASDFGSLFSFSPFVDGEIAASIIELLHSEGVDLNAADRNRRTPLHYAAIAGDPLVINRLLSLGVTPDSPDASGHTPLQLAVRSGYYSYIPNLIRKAGASSQPDYLDYLAGTKNNIASSIIAHPFIAIGAALLPIIAYSGSFIIKGLTPKSVSAKDKGPRNSQRSSDITLTKPNLSIPPPPSVGSGLKGGLVTPVNPLSSSAPSKATTSPKKAPETPKTSKTTLVKSATQAINDARRNRNNAAILSALEKAEAILKNRQELDDEARPYLKHLIAAIKSLLKSADNGVQTRAQNLVKLYST